MNPQEEQEYQERMGSPEMEYLQYQTDFPEQHPPMTTLNTIIEEEKKGAKESVLETFDDGTIRYCPRDLETKITTAMQRAYEAGKADNAQANTPDTEWEKEFEKLMPEVSYEFCQGHLNDGIAFISNLLTSRDTYWRETISTAIAGETDQTRARIMHNLDILDNLK